MLRHVRETSTATHLVDHARGGGRPATVGSRGLRVVMVVANDITRDSRVLREAAVLAKNGYQVTVLGILTARTTAPEVELRDGFVIRRLRYRAKPPEWWIPPDFYARVRYQSDRQYRIHRARIVALTRRGSRQLRVAISRTGSARSAFKSTTTPRPTSGTERRIWLVPRRVVQRSVGAVGHAGLMIRSQAGRIRSVLARARRTPIYRWPVKTRALLRRQWDRGRGPHDRPNQQRRFGRGRYRSLAGGIRGVARAARSVARGATARSVRIGKAIGRGVRAWAGLATLLAWGSTYLLANRVTAGAIEWQTGWRWRWLGWARFIAAHAPDADVWHGHDMTSLPAIVELKRQRGGLAVYDSHEVYFESGRHADQPRWAKAPLEALERRLVREVDAVVTVNRSLADILGRRFGRAEVAVLHNCPPRATKPMRRALLRRAIGVARRTPLIMYHGSLAPHRGIEQLLEAICRPQLAGVHLAFLGFGPKHDWLRVESRHGRYAGRVHVLNAVPPDELADWLSGVDVAVAPIQASTLNHRYSSPNKVFEAIAAGTPVAGSDFAEFRRVITDPQFGSLGALFDPSSPEDIASAVAGLLRASPTERADLRRRCRIASDRRWNWETESGALVDLYSRFSSQRFVTQAQSTERAGVA